MGYGVDRVELQEQPAAIVRGLVLREAVAEFFAGAFGEVIEVIAAQGLHPVGEPFGRFVPTDDGFQVEAGLPTSAPVEPVGRVVPSVLPGGHAVQVLHKGSYDTVGSAYEAAESWLADNGWEATSPPWESYLDGPEVPEPRTLVSLPCRPRDALP